MRAEAGAEIPLRRRPEDGAAPVARLKPGVIGRVGTMFGEEKVNIANMAVSRTKEGGKALMAGTAAVAATTAMGGLGNQLTSTFNNVSTKMAAS